MEWTIGLIVGISFLSLVLAYIIYILLSKKRNKYAIAILVGLVFLGSSAMFFPIYYHAFEGDKLIVLKTIGLSFHNSIRLFVLDGDFEIIFNSTGGLEGNLRSLYHGVVAILYILAPILTAGFVLSFAKNALAFIKFKLSANKEVFIFSELNKKTINLAITLKKAKKKAAIVFCDITDASKEEHNDIYEDLLDLNAIIFAKDITTLHFNHHSKDKNKGVQFFIIGDDDEKNVLIYSKLVHQHAKMANGKIYLFSRSSQSELSFNQHIENRKIQCRKYDSDFLIINNYLFEKGIDLFKTAREVDGKKVISVAVIGLGLYGKTFVKALSWFCQMDGYELEVNAYDNDPKAVSKFKAEAPELLNPAFHHPDNKEENQYIINIHPGIDVNTLEFLEEIDKIGDRTTAVFVCLGDDERNVEAAIKARMILARHNNKCLITAVVYSGKKDFINNVTNFKGQEYNIACIGDYETSYSYGVVVDSQLEKLAIEAHGRYCKNEEEKEALFSYAYNFRSSYATVIHRHVRELLDINGANKPADQLTKEEIEATNILEHRRWSAWMRSEGYVHGDPRNDMAKYHHDIKLYSELDEATQYLDTVVAIKDIKKDKEDKDDKK